MKEVWRYLEGGAAPGAWNMALDEAMAIACGAGEAPPTLRVYAWEPPCLSLGRFQPADVVDVAACARAGVDVVRRPSGGRAVFHQDEVTFAVVLPRSHPLAEGSVRSAYARISAGLTEGLRLLGLPSEQAATIRTGDHRTPACFASASYAEATVAGRKVLGSAQWRTHDAVLQHGSIPVGNDHALMVSLLNIADNEVRKRLVHTLETSTISLSEALGRIVEPEDVAQALRRGFELAADVIFESDAVSSREQELARGLTLRYSSLDWDERKETPEASRALEADSTLGYHDGNGWDASTTDRSLVTGAGPRTQS